ncbi:MAG TPA: hypothetical protein VG474_05655 [Solirubrobacteraceae bacterium]|nr:hypothetical protein [Solirubrobacteraceae bacterium]
MAAGPFHPVMTHFTLPLHATREELVALAADWAAEHELHVSLERFFPLYSPAALPPRADLESAIAEFEPVRRICLRRGDFDVGATSDVEHLARNPESLAVVLEPLTEDGLRATALTARMGDEEVLRWWVALVRESVSAMHRGATAVAPGGVRTAIADHLHTAGAHELAAAGVPMLAATGATVFEFDDLA